MKSNLCRIDNETKNLESIFRESEKVAAYNGFSHKQTLQLRLLCEEIDGMLPNVIENFDGNLWIEYENGLCKINVSLQIPSLNIAEKEALIGVAKNRKNAASVGIVGKIRSAIEDFLLNEASINTLITSSDGHQLSLGYSTSLDYSCIWTLNNYRTNVQKENQAEAWDELEKSVIASVADDVIVGVKGNRADIIVIKKFA